MVRRQLRDEQWSRVERVLLSQRRTGRRGRDDRGAWKTVLNRFDRWSKDGRWTRLFEALRVDPDDE